MLTGDESKLHASTACQQTRRLCASGKQAYSPLWRRCAIVGAATHSNRPFTISSYLRAQRGDDSWLARRSNFATDTIAIGPQTALKG